MKVPIKYVPKTLTNADKKRQVNALRKSKRMYKKGVYFTRKRVKSFTSKPSNHISNARRIYRVENITPNAELSLKTGCSISALKQIVRKGEGAYYSSGSRPNQTAQSWGNARLASAITGGKAASVDYHIIENGCNHNKTAFILANKSRKNGAKRPRKPNKISI